MGNQNNYKTQYMRAAKQTYYIVIIIICIQYMYISNTIIIQKPIIHAIYIAVATAIPQRPMVVRFSLFGAGLVMSQRPGKYGIQLMKWHQGQKLDWLSGRR